MMSHFISVFVIYAQSIAKIVSQCLLATVMVTQYSRVYALLLY